MINLPRISEDDVRAKVTEQSYDRGMDAASLRALVCQLIDADPGLVDIVDAFSAGGLT